MLPTQGTTPLLCLSGKRADSVASEGGAGVQGPCAGQAFLDWVKEQLSGWGLPEQYTSHQQESSALSCFLLEIIKVLPWQRVLYLVFNHLKPTLLCIALISPHNNPGTSYFKHQITYRGN